MLAIMGMRNDRCLARRRVLVAVDEDKIDQAQDAGEVIADVSR